MRAGGSPKWPGFHSTMHLKSWCRQPPCRCRSRVPLVRRHLWDIVQGFFPGGLVADRTALELAPAPDGSVFLVAQKGGKIGLPGIVLRARRGQPPFPDDFKLRDSLYCASTARALLENMRPSRARSGAARTL